MHRSVASGPDPWAGDHHDGLVEGESDGGLQWRASQEPAALQPRDPQRPGPDWHEPQRPGPDWHDPQRPGPDWHDLGPSRPQQHDPRWRDLQEPGPQRPDPGRPGRQQRAPQQGDLQPRGAERTGPQRFDDDWRDLQRPGAQRPGPQQRDPREADLQRRDMDWGEPRRPSPRRPGPQQDDRDWSGPGRHGPDWRDPQRDPQQRRPGRRGPQRPGAQRPGPLRPVPDWRERHRRALQQQLATQQRDPGWDDPGWEGPGGSGPRGLKRPGSRRRGRKRTPLHKRRWAQVTAALLTAFLISVSWSVGHALTMPGGGTLSDRLAEWARDHYLGPVVTFGEWLTYQAPKKGGRPGFSLSNEGIAAVKAQAAKLHGRRAAALAACYAPPLPLKSLAGTPLQGEGQWRVLAAAHGRPAVFGTYLRASSVYSSYVAGIAELSQCLVRFQLRPGTEDPGGSNWGAQPYIPPGTRTGLLATFNSGFKIAQSGGGFYLNGQRSGTLINGVASVVYYRNGHLTIGVWGQTVRMTPDVVGVRQNLHLIVQNGQIPATVDANVESSWGATLGGGYYVWRSGIGETRNGRIVFAYGPALNVREIAELLQRAGAVTGMQLDINPAWMSFMYYEPKHHPADPTPLNLLPGQNQAPDRYYSISGRDFTVVYSR